MQSTGTQVQTKKPTYDELMAQIAALKASQQGNIRLKIGEKGGIVFGGLGAHPWAPYLSQLLAVVRAIRSGEVESFLLSHYVQLSQKDNGAPITREDITEAFK